MANNNDKSLDSNQNRKRVTNWVRKSLRRVLSPPSWSTPLQICSFLSRRLNMNDFQKTFFLVGDVAILLLLLRNWQLIHICTILCLLFLAARVVEPPLFLYPWLFEVLKRFFFFFGKLVQLIFFTYRWVFRMKHP